MLENIHPLFSLFLAIFSWWGGTVYQRSKDKNSELSRLIDDAILDLENLSNDVITYYVKPRNSTEANAAGIRITSRLYDLVNRSERLKSAFSSSHFRLLYADPIATIYKDVTGNDFQQKSDHTDSISIAEEKVAKIKSVISNLKDRKADINSRNILRRFSIDH